MAKKKRVVHFASYGCGGLVFSCYAKEIASHLASSNGEYFVKYSKPDPLRRADLRQVTCPECWQNIQEMAVAFSDVLS